MSSGRAGAFRGRGRGSTFAATNTTTTGASTRTSSGHGGRGDSATRPATNTIRGVFGQMSRGRGARAPRATRGNAFTAPAAPRKLAKESSNVNLDWQERYQILRTKRDQERANAIRQGLIADPNKPMKLEDAITPVGTCQEMCAEFERVERVVRNDVLDEEKDPNNGNLPDETRMVKRFKRSAAGDAEQLPSDLRPARVLRETCDYLFNEVVGKAPDLSKVHHFVWDRTRAIRNDFSIQQMTKMGDIKIAIECYERIARFHIASLHTLAGPERPYAKYDPQQEREQLDRTLLSLIQYYEDYKGRLELPNEIEFRAYLILFQIQDRIPDLEDRIQSWPRHVIISQRVQEALKVYAAACNTVDQQGPFFSQPAKQVIARQDWEAFWNRIASNRVSYLMACVTEIYFNLIRQITLQAIVRISRAGKPGAPITDWTVDALWDSLNFDDEQEFEEFVGRYGIQLQVRPEDGQRYLDINSLAGKALPQPESGRRGTQLKSQLVERKREGRTLPAIINGLSIRQARDAGQIADEEADEDEMIDVDDVVDDAEEQEMSDEDSLFVPEQRKENAAAKEKPEALTSAFSWTKPTTLASPFAQKPTQQSGASTTSFPFAQKPTQQFGSSGFGQPSNPVAQKPSQTVESQVSSDKQPKFDSLQPAKPVKGIEELTPSSAPSILSGADTPATLGLEIDSSGSTNPTSLKSATSTPKTSLFANAGQTFNVPASALFPTTSNLGDTALNGLFSKPKPTPTTTALTPSGEAKALPSPASGWSFGGASQSTTQSQEVTKPTFSWDQSNTSAAPTAQPELNFKPAGYPQSSTNTTSHSQSQPPAPAVDQTQQGQSSNKGTLSDSRRQSINSGHDNKPKKPSPLSNSFTAEEPVSASTASQSAPSPDVQSARELFPAKQPTKQAPSAPASSISESDAVLTRLAKELTFDPISGTLKQYVEFYVRGVVKEVESKVYFERIEEEAKEFRQFFLEDKFGRKWRDTVRLKKLKKRGNARRERTRRRLVEAQVAEGIVDVSELDKFPTRDSSRALSVIAQPRLSEQERLDMSFRSTATRRDFVAEKQARAEGKRPASSLDGEMMPPPDMPSHKRAKSSGQVAERSRPTKSAPTISPHSDVLQRSSFLGFSAADGQDRPSTTKSTYFRMKALGLKPKPQEPEYRGTKRSRSDSLDAASAKLQSRLEAASLRSSTGSDHLGDSRALVKPSPSRSVRSKINEDDDALFARLRAARDALADGEDFMKAEVVKEEELRRSRSLSRSNSDSPSMERARAGARLRASKADSEHEASFSGARDVPAYRMRESRFVPRERYGRAMERANEIRAARSRETSRAPSQTEQEQTNEPNQIIRQSREVNPPAVVLSPKTNGIVSQPPSAESSATSAPAAQSAWSNLSLGSPPGVSRPTGVDPQPSNTQQTRASNPFSHFSSFAHPTQHGPSPLSQAANINPFSQASSFIPPDTAAVDQASPVAASSNSLFGFGYTSQSAAPAQESKFGFQDMDRDDFTVQHSQIPAALSHSFGHPPAGQSPFGATTHGSPTPPQTHSYVHSKAASEAISLVSDDDEEAAQNGIIMRNGQGELYTTNGNVGVFEPTISIQHSDATGSLESIERHAPSNSYANKFAVLENYHDAAGGETGDEDEQSGYSPQGEYQSDNDAGQDPDSYQYGNATDEEQEGEDDEEFDSESREGMPNGFARNGHPDEYSDEESGQEGDIENEGDYDEGDYEDGDDDEEEGEDDSQPYANSYMSAANQLPFPKPQLSQVNDALQSVGNHEDDAIELSD